MVTGAGGSEGGPRIERARRKGGAVAKGGREVKRRRRNVKNLNLRWIIGV